MEPRRRAVGYRGELTHALRFLNLVVGADVICPYGVAHLIARVEATFAHEHPRDGDVGDDLHKESADHSAARTSRAARATYATRASCAARAAYVARAARATYAARAARAARAVFA
jgi:hypothetical protein